MARESPADLAPWRTLWNSLSTATVASTYRDALVWAITQRRSRSPEELPIHMGQSERRDGRARWKTCELKGLALPQVQQFLQRCDLVSLLLEFVD